MIEYKYVLTISRAMEGPGAELDAYGFCAGIFSDAIQAIAEVETKINTLLSALPARCKTSTELATLEKTLKVVEENRFAWTRYVEYATHDGVRTKYFFHIEEVEV